MTTAQNGIFYAPDLKAAEHIQSATVAPAPAGQFPQLLMLGLEKEKEEVRAATLIEYGATCGFPRSMTNTLFEIAQIAGEPDPTWSAQITTGD